MFLNGVELQSSKDEKLLEFLEDQNLNFGVHIKSMCSKAS